MSFKNPASNNEHLLSLAVMAVLQRTALQCSSDVVIDFTRAPQTAALAEQFLAQLEEALRARLEPDTGVATAPATASAPEPTPMAVTPVEDAQAPASSTAPDAQVWTPPSLSADAPAPAHEIVADAADPAAAEPAAGTEPTAEAPAPVASAVEASAASAAAPSPAAEAVSPASTPPQVTAMLSSASASQRTPPIRFQLPNAKEGQAFDGRPVPQTSRPLTIIRAVFPSELGLSLDEAEQRIVGTPVKSGEFMVEIEYRFHGEPDNVMHFANTPLTVIPDPRLLWKDIPSDQAVPFWKPDCECGRLEDGAARLVAASQRGRSHAHKGTCRDDDYFIGTANGWRIAVVADGAGSAKYSRRGAQLAARTAGEFMAKALIEDAELLKAAESGADGADALKKALYHVVGHAAHVAMKALNDESRRGGAGGLPLALSDLNTTLLIAVARPLGGRMVVGTYTVGDGAVGILSGGDRVDLGGVPDGGEFSGGTRFLAPAYVESDELWARTRAFVLDKVEAIVLMSDGVSDPKFKSDRALETREAWDTLMLDITAGTGFDVLAPGLSEGLEARLLDWLGFWVPGEHDDRTIAIIW